MMKAERIQYGDPKAAVDKVIYNSNLEIAAAIASQAKLHAPVDYGQLRNSISASNLKTTVLLNNMAGERGERLDTTGLKGSEVYVGANVEHAAPQEYGRKKMAAQPYLRPAKEKIVDGSTKDEIIKKWDGRAFEEEMKKIKRTKMK